MMLNFLFYGFYSLNFIDEITYEILLVFFRGRIYSHGENKRNVFHGLWMLTIRKLYSNWCLLWDENILKYLGYCFSQAPNVDCCCCNYKLKLILLWIRQPKTQCDHIESNRTVHNNSGSNTISKRSFAFSWNINFRYHIVYIKVRNAIECVRCAFGVSKLATIQLCIMHNTINKIDYRCVVFMWMFGTRCQTKLS